MDGIGTGVIAVGEDRRRRDRRQKTGNRRDAPVGGAVEELPAGVAAQGAVGAVEYAGDGGLAGDVVGDGLGVHAKVGSGVLIGGGGDGVGNRILSK